VDNPDDRWRKVAARLITDTELFERRFDRDFVAASAQANR